MPTSTEGYGWIKPEMLTDTHKEELLQELVQEYVAKRDKISQLQEDVASVKWHIDQLREFDTKHVWCHTCNKRHRIGTQVSHSRKHNCVKIPKRCLSKYDHIWEYLSYKDTPVAELTEGLLQGKPLGKSATVGKYQCIVCGTEKEVITGW